MFPSQLNFAKGRKRRALVIAMLAALVMAVLAGDETTAVSGESMRDLSFALLNGNGEARVEAAHALAERGNQDAIAALVLAARYIRGDKEVLAALSVLAGEPIDGWKEAMEWQEAHSEVAPHPSFRALKLALLEEIDPGFMRFLGEERSLRENMRIRLEEIVWGGVAVDGIPSLDNPALVAASNADYLADSDLVFGVAINGDARAYPLRIMGWHEMFNETIGGVDVALAYCTLCGSGILFETHVEGREEPFIFGSSGLLYRSNKLMFDRETDSLWNQFTGEPVAGPLVGSGIKLEVRPVVITSWAKWREANPATKVLSVETGHVRDYRSGIVYAEYFASPELMFPAIVRDEERLERKDYVFGVRVAGASKAWPLDLFKGGGVINDHIGAREVVLVGNEETREVRAYERAGREFEFAPGGGGLKAADGVWAIGEDALTGPDGARLARLPGHVSYWFAWDSYLGGESELADR